MPVLDEVISIIESRRVIIQGTPAVVIAGDQTFSGRYRWTAGQRIFSNVDFTVLAASDESQIDSGYATSPWNPFNRPLVPEQFLRDVNGVAALGLNGRWIWNRFQIGSGVVGTPQIWPNRNDQISHRYWVALVDNDFLTNYQYRVIDYLEQRGYPRTQAAIEELLTDLELRDVIVGRSIGFGRGLQYQPYYCRMFEQANSLLLGHSTTARGADGINADSVGPILTPRLSGELVVSITNEWRSRDGSNEEAALETLATFRYRIIRSYAGPQLLWPRPDRAYLYELEPISHVDPLHLVVSRPFITVSSTEAAHYTPGTADRAVDEVFYFRIWARRTRAGSDVEIGGVDLEDETVTPTSTWEVYSRYEQRLQPGAEFLDRDNTLWRVETIEPVIDTNKSEVVATLVEYDYDAVTSRDVDVPRSLDPSGPVE